MKIFKQLFILATAFLLCSGTMAAKQYTAWGVVYELQPDGKSLRVVGTTPETGEFSVDIYETIKIDETEYTVTGIQPGAFTDCVAEYLNIYSRFITTISPYTFAGMKHVLKVSLSDNVISIGEGAFAGCQKLERIEGGEYKRISNKMCENCKALQGISIPKTVTVIGDWAFSHCESLTFVLLPEGVTRIGDCAFEYCSSLEEVATGDHIKYVGDYAFAICPKLRSITLPSSGVTFGMDWFIKEFK